MQKEPTYKLAFKTTTPPPPPFEKILPTPLGLAPTTGLVPPVCFTTLVPRLLGFAPTKERTPSTLAAPTHDLNLHSVQASQVG